MRAGYADGALAPADGGAMTGEAAGLRARWFRLDLRWRVVSVGVALAALVVVLDRLTSVLGGGEVLDAGGEQNLVTWLTSMSFAAAAAASFAAASLGEGRPLAWFSIAAFAGLLSLDEIAMLHERTEEELGGQVIVDYVEPVIAVVALALGVYAARVVSARERAMLLCAVSTLAAAVFVGAANSDSISTFVANGLSVLEEALELMVPFFILAAALPAVVVGLRRRYAGRPNGQSRT